MNIIFYLAHPAHFHLFKKVIENLIEHGSKVTVTIKTKDILSELLEESGISYINISKKSRRNGKLAVLTALITRSILMLKIIFKTKPQLIISSSTEFGPICRFTGVKNVAVYEDDIVLFPLVYHFLVPFTHTLVCPISCNNGKWGKKTVSYRGFNELAYLHPNHFTPDKSIVEKYFQTNRPYFILRFAKLTAWHDDGIKGINSDLASQIISILEPYGEILITSERELETRFEKYRMQINPMDIHHVLAFASLYIGDSQTMAAEAGVLGTPFIRFNDFVGRIGYLAELEDKYHLGYGIKPGNENILFQKVRELIEMKDLKNVFSSRREKMLLEKIDVAKFLIWFIEKYPESVQVMKRDPGNQYKFR